MSEANVSKGALVGGTLLVVIVDMFVMFLQVFDQWYQVFHVAR